MFYDKVRIKQDISYILIWSLSILYKSKFNLLATFLRTNAVVVTRVHCNIHIIIRTRNIQINQQNRTIAMLNDDIFYQIIMQAENEYPDQIVHLGLRCT